MYIILEAVTHLIYTNMSLMTLLSLTLGPNQKQLIFKKHEYIFYLYIKGIGRFISYIISYWKTLFEKHLSDALQTLIHIFSTLSF